MDSDSGSDYDMDLMDSTVTGTSEAYAKSFVRQHPVTEHVRKSSAGETN